jgi:hypothetical protein
MHSEERNSSMRTSVRLALLACASFVALAVANAAWAAYAPSLIAAPASHALGAKNTLFLGVAQTRTDDPTAKIDILVPAGYQENYNQAVGSTIGDVSAVVILRAAGDAEVTVTGTVRVDNPADPKYVSPAQNRCAPGLHTNVWVLNVSISGSPLQVPIYVDDLTAVPGASARIQLCLLGPVGTPSGAQLLSALFAVKGVFTNPSSRNVYAWSALFTPYFPGTPNPNLVGTVEGRALVPIPVRIAITARKRGKVATLSGTITLPGGLLPARLELWAGPSARRLRRVARVSVSGRGRFSARRRITKTTVFGVRVELVGASIPLSTGCAGASRAPRGCVSATMSIDAASNLRTVRVRKRR